MGKGKKKDKKKNVETEKVVSSLAELSVSGSEPSTSRETSAVPEEESAVAEAVCVKAKVTQEKPTSTPEPSEPTPPKPTLPEPPVKAVEEEEPDGLGLDKSSRKKRPRKKKTGPGDTAPQVVGTQPTPTVLTPSQSAPGWSGHSGEPQAVVQQPSAPSTQPPWFSGAQQQKSAWGAQNPSSVPGPQPIRPQVAQPAGAPSTQPPGFSGALPPGFSAAQPPGFPGATPPRYPGAQPPGFPGAQAPGFPGAQPPGFPGAQSPGFPGPQRSGFPPGPQQQPMSAGRGVGRAQAQGSRPPMQQQPAQPPQQYQPVKQGDSQSQAICLSKIPSKIIGKSVPARPVNVLTNYLPMIIKWQKINRYDVSFKPEKPKKLIPKAFAATRDLYFPKYLMAFDQSKNFYTLQPLPNVTQTERFTGNVEVTDPNGKVLNFEVTFKMTGVVDLSTIRNYMANGTSLNTPTEAIQCIDVILRQGTLESYVKAGRQFFKRPEKPIKLGDGLEMWTGLFQSAIFTSRAFINIDVAHKGFPIHQPMVRAISEEFRLDLARPLTEQRGRGLETFQTFIKGLRVLATIVGDTTSAGQRREFICNDLVEPPHKIMFDLTDPQGRVIKMSVADYFQKVKKVRLRYPNLNCMWVGPRDKSIYYPMELLEVAPGQALNKQLNDIQLATMVREAATPPDERKRKIHEVMNAMKFSDNKFFKAFGLEIKSDFFPVQAKVLRPPILEVGGGKIEPRRGVWQANRLLKAEALESWAFIAIECDPSSSNGGEIISLLKNTGSQLGMRISEPKEVRYNVRITELYNVLFTALQKEIKFLVIVVPTRGRDFYHRVKQVAEQEVGILTQCIKQYTAQRRMNPQTAKNILLKVNSKLMGINQALDHSSIPRCIQAGGVMVVGADVTHPSPDQSSVPSIAAVTASIDPKCFIYNIQLSIQTPKKEVIVEFEDMMVEHLQVYRKRQRDLPRKIYVFRDGVSEGQFAQVMNSELQAVHNAYQRLSGTPKKPEVLFLLVQKRHHTRFFIPNSSNNVEPGTVVDTDIVHARELDFYLVSHQAIKGTARPTRYHAVCNDGGIPHDEVEQLTFYLCHLYSRCMRSVSYPTPTYYAHLACMRARSLTHGRRFDNSQLEKKPERLNVLDKMLEFSRMFFV